MSSSSDNDKSLYIAAKSGDLSKKIQKPLEDLTELEVHHLLESLNLTKYIEVFKQNEVDGRTLQNCRSEEDVKQLGITMTAKARVLLNEIEKRRSLGLSIEQIDGSKQKKSDTILLKQTDDGDNDTVSFMSDNTKPIKYRSVKDDDDGDTIVDKETVVTTGQTGGYVPRDNVSIKPKEMDVKTNGSLIDGDGGRGATSSLFDQPLSANSSMKYSIPFEEKRDPESSFVDDQVVPSVAAMSETKEYIIDLAQYFPDLLTRGICDDLLIKQVIGVDDYSCEFVLNDSGFKGNEIVIVVSVTAAQKIFNHTERKSSVLTVKEIPASIFDGELVSSIISFEPSGVVFTTAAEDNDGRVDHKDSIIVTIPTMMSWEGNVELNRLDVINNLKVLCKDHEDDEHWKAAFNETEMDLNGVITVNPNDGDSRINATFVVDHFSCFAMGSFLSLLFRKSAYALCAMSKGDVDSSSFKIQCCVCKDDPVEQKCYFIVQAIHWKTIYSNHLHANFHFTSIEDNVNSYYLRPMEKDTNVEIKDVCQSYFPDFNRNLGRYNLSKGSEDLRLRSHIELTIYGKRIATPLIIEIPMSFEEVPIQKATHSISTTSQSSIQQSTAFNYKDRNNPHGNDTKSSETQTDYTQIALQVGGGLCSGLLFLSKQIPIIGKFANVLEGALKIIEQALTNHNAFQRLNGYLVQISQLLLPNLQNLSTDPSFEKGLQNLITALEKVITFVQSHEQSLLTKAYDARDDKTLRNVDNYIIEIANCKDILMNLLQIEDHKMLKQIATFLLEKNHTDGSGASHTMSNTDSCNAAEKPRVTKKKLVPLRLDADGWQVYNPGDYESSARDDDGDGRELTRLRAVAQLGGNVVHRQTFHHGISR